MRTLAAFSLAALVFLAVGTFAADEKAPDKIVFEAKNGNVTFEHAKHVAREKNDCTHCHDKLFQKSRAPINFKAAMHKTAIASKSACAACHMPEGKSFAIMGNCVKCHAKKG